MTRLQVRVEPESGSLVIGHPEPRAKARDYGTGAYLMHLNDVRGASATELGHALARSGNSLDVSETDYSLFDDEYSPATNIGFVWTDEGLQIDIIFFLDDLEDETTTQDNIRRTVDPLLRRAGWKYREAEMDGRSVASPWLWHLRVRPRVRAQTVGDLYDIATGIGDLVNASCGGGLRRETVLELLRGGRPEILIGQAEGDWLDVKSQDYDLSGDPGKISLAQDVARFANAEYGGIVVIGMGAKKVGDKEIIRNVRAIPWDPGACDVIGRLLTGICFRRLMD